MCFMQLKEILTGESPHPSRSLLGRVKSAELYEQQPE